MSGLAAHIPRLRAHADSIIACDFFTVETLWLGRLMGRTALSRWQHRYQGLAYASSVQARRATFTAKDRLGGLIHEYG